MYFDELPLDDTILDFKKGQHDALFSACGEFGLEITESDYLVYDRINKTSWKRYERKEVEKIMKGDDFDD